MICSNCGSESKEIFGIAGDNLLYKCVACYALQPEIAIEARSRLELDSDVSYEIYSQVISSLNPAYVAAFEFKVPSVLKVLWSDLKELASHLKSEFGIGLEEVVKGFQQKSIFALLKGVAFSLKKLVSAIHEGISILSKELYKALAALHDSGAFKHVEKSAKAVDAILEQHPVLKKLAGPAVAGILLVIYLKSSFLGDMNKDLALVDALVACLKGNFTIYELFASKDGIYALATLAIGLMTGASAISYGYSTVEKTLKFLGSDGHNVYNLALAIFYAAAKKAKLEFNHKEGTRILGMKLEAKSRLIATETPEWFSKLDKESQDQYLKDHPNSKIAKDAKSEKENIKQENTKPKYIKNEDAAESILHKFKQYNPKVEKRFNSNGTDKIYVITFDPSKTKNLTKQKVEKMRNDLRSEYSGNQELDIRLEKYMGRVKCYLYMPIPENELSKMYHYILRNG